MFLYCGRLIISVAHHFLLIICNLPPHFCSHLLSDCYFSQSLTKKYSHFRWFCAKKCIFATSFNFSQHPREMFITNNENFPCYLFIYFMVYILPMVLILASRFFFLCWRYRIPFFYFASINAAHIVEWSWYTTNDMIVPALRLW